MWCLIGHHSDMIFRFTIIACVFYASFVSGLIGLSCPYLLCLRLEMLIMFRHYNILFVPNFYLIPYISPSHVFFNYCNSHVFHWQSILCKLGRIPILRTWLSTVTKRVSVTCSIDVAPENRQSTSSMVWVHNHEIWSVTTNSPLPRINHEENLTVWRYFFLVATSLA
jgi:hypothetical protein